jgi:ubiquinone/menaquinone biosynthesis C-methylase UbiE
MAKQIQSPNKMSEMNTTTRFSDRVADYDLYRPSYPAALLDHLDSRVPLRGSRVADVGAGTGIFSKLLLERGAIVDAVEPNTEMGHAAVKNLSAYPGFNFCPGTAENTGLSSASIGLITSAQAFHWFDVNKTRAEFDRILKAGGKIALVWNVQKKDDFGQAYEEIKDEFGGAAFEKVSAITKRLDDFLPEFFMSGDYEATLFDNFHELDERGLIGRFFSTSYAPKAKSEEAAAAKNALLGLFNKFQRSGRVRFEYQTELFLGD